MESDGSLPRSQKPANLSLSWAREQFVLLLYIRVVTGSNPDALRSFPLSAPFIIH
jgi:hypothetical protein